MPHKYQPPKRQEIVQLTVRLPAKLEKRVRNEAKKKDISLNAALTDILCRHYRTKV